MICWACCKAALLEELPDDESREVELPLALLPITPLAVDPPKSTDEDIELDSRSMRVVEALGGGE